MTPSQFVRSDDVVLAVYTWGSRSEDQNKPVVVLVHGYPDSAEVWTQVAEQLSEHFFVVAYDVRGAGQSTAPKNTNGYQLEYLVQDLAAVVDAISPDQPIHLVGHDWGSLQSWEAVMSERLYGRIASFSTGTPALDHAAMWFRRHLQTPTLNNLLTLGSQVLGSSYMLIFQLPLLPEAYWQVLVGRNWSRILGWLEGIQSSPSNTQTEDGVNGLNLYRANVLPKLMNPNPRRVELPVNLMLMTNDRFVPERVFDGIEEWVPQLYRTHIDAGHWAPLSHPREMSAVITEFVYSL
ncbi:alpha/beta fold hydrolase [Litoribrevibacter albus]|uniref:AB hydrolase-1 domain-containing protein n=1 Tax=Litoribrevibacter albus TaxID=1473156 RepID=A0AA37S686_9GAMM|nr:alpha/beta fold hydrolase [Litoribrevibacter albus]GLQ29991.1 hypothetical protein GCM10007876_04690 [Litoribrevibacter albus]